MSPIQKRTVCDVMESVFLSVNEHLTSVGEELVDALCVLQLQEERRRHHVRLFVLQRLRVAAQWMCSLVHRELTSLLEADATQLHNKLHTDYLLHLPACEEQWFPEHEHRRSSLDQEEEPQPPPHIQVRLPKQLDIKAEQQESRSSLVQEEHQPPHIKEEQEEVADVSTVTIVQMRCNTDLDVPSSLEEVCKRERRSPSPLPEEEPQPPQPCVFLEGPECPRHQDRSLGRVKQESRSPLRSPPSEDDLLLVQRRRRPAEPPAFSNSTSSSSSSSSSVKARPSPSEEPLCSARRSQASTRTFQRTAAHLKSHRTGQGNAGGVAGGVGGSPPYTCPVCGKGCSQSGLLKIHMRSHTGEKPFVCAVCGKGCVDASGLRSHMKTHTGERPFVCTVCGKGCSRKNDLKIHLRTHTGEKPFTCALCGKSFVHVGHLRRHMKTHMSF